MADIVALKAEITNDPLGRGYSAMTDQEVADNINAEYRTRNRVFVTGDEVFQQVANRSVWDTLLDTQKLQFLSFCARAEIDPFATANEEFVKSIFGNASSTVANLASLRIENISRGTELGLGFIRSGHVQEARR